MKTIEIIKNNGDIIQAEILPDEFTLSFLGSHFVNYENISHNEALLLAEFIINNIQKK